MNPKAALCLIIALVTALAGFGTMKMREHSQLVARQADKSRSEADTATNSRKGMERRLATLRTSSKEKRDHFKKWETHFARTETTKSAEEMLKRAMDNGPLLLSGKFVPVQRKGEKFIPTVVRGNLTFEDRYDKVIGWLGSLETKLPTCRITECVLSRGASDQSVRLKMTIDQPVSSSRDKKTTKS